MASHMLSMLKLPIKIIIKKAPKSCLKQNISGTVRSLRMELTPF